MLFTFDARGCAVFDSLNALQLLQPLDKAWRVSLEPVNVEDDFDALGSDEESVEVEKVGAG
jgi:hypothetical protein